MTRRAQIIVSVVFVAVITVPGLLALAGVRLGGHIDENRAPNELPGLDAGAVGDQATYDAFGAWFSDRIPLRDVTIKATRRLDEALSLNEAARLGRPSGADGWLYHWDTLLEECRGGAPSTFVDDLDAAAEEMARVGIPFVYVVVPDKVSVYPEHQRAAGLAGLLGLGSREVPGCAARWNGELRTAAASREHLSPLLDDLLADVDGPAGPLYWARDTHWTDAGMAHFVRAVLDALGGGDLWDDDALERVEDVSNEGDLLVLRGESGTDVAAGFEIVREGVRVDQAQILGGGPHAVEVHRSTSTAAPLVAGSTWIIGDSSAHTSLALLAPYFQELVFVPWQALEERSITDVVAEVGSTPSAVVLEEIQRNIAKDHYAPLLLAASELAAAAG